MTDPGDRTQVPTPPPAGGLAAQVIGLLTGRGQTLAVAESLTGGLVAARLVDVPGASAVLRGAVVAYATELKHQLLGVDPALLAEHGAVHPEVARQMSAGVRDRLGADFGLATTGVAGPLEQDGQSPGTVYVAVSQPAAAASSVRRLQVAGDRAQVRDGSVNAVLELLLEVLDRPGGGVGEIAG